MVQESSEAHMTDASTRIWAWPHFDGWITGDWSANTYHDERTVEYILATEHDRIVAEKDAEIARLREALTPSAETKAAYWSEVECDCPTETWRHYVPWTSIKQIMKMIRARAALKGDSDE